MKRTRSATAAANASQNRIHTCSYRGCHKQFKSEKSLQAHLPTHQASYPLICPHKPCKSRFAVQSEQDRHVRNVHIPPRRSLRNLRNKDEQPRGAEVLLPSDEGSETPLEASKHAHERQSVSDNKTEEEDEAELEEIIDNAVYLASQIKVARVCVARIYMFLSTIISWPCLTIILSSVFRVYQRRVIRLEAGKLRTFAVYIYGHTGCKKMLRSFKMVLV